jgi:hypothetical protein
MDNKYRQALRMEERMRTKNLLSLFAVIALVMLGTSGYAGDKPAAVYGSGANQFSLATGSPGELGLLKVLAEAFGKQNNAKMNTARGYITTRPTPSNTMIKRSGAPA